MGLRFKNDPAHIIPENFENDDYKVTGYNLIYRSMYVTVVFKETDEPGQHKYRRVLADAMRRGLRI